MPRTVEELESAPVHGSYQYEVDLITEVVELIADTSLPLDVRLRALNVVDRVQDCAEEPLREEDLDRFLKTWRGE